MKRFLLLIAAIFLVASVRSSTLVLIPTKNSEETKSLFSSPNLNIHYYNDNFVIATTSTFPEEYYVILDKTPWQKDFSYYIVHFDKSVDISYYLNSIQNTADVLYATENLLVVSTNEQKYGQLQPAKNDGMVRVFNSTARLPLVQHDLFIKNTSVDPFIEELLEEVDSENITAIVQHLQDYGTRNVYYPESAHAQIWIAEKLEDLGLSVELMDFEMPGNPASGNVIATLEGTEEPSEYVVVGGHFDSISWSGDEPGADDNASGTAAVMEIARILSQYEFNKSIIFCAFSGEEYGLYGSAAYAKRCAEEGKNILGYVNMDMIGYLEPGNTMLTSLIFPYFATPLAEYYTAVTSIYLPDFPVQNATLSGGDSDHTSFNNNGYMGIFPFENIDAYSPYIHTSNDLIGPSYNNEEQAVVFTQAALATIVSLANSIHTSSPIYTPSFSLYPNPASDYINIEIGSENWVKLEVVNSLGQNVFNNIFRGNGYVSTSSWAKGIYFFKISDDLGQKVERVIIQ